MVIKRFVSISLVCLIYIVFFNQIIADKTQAQDEPESDCLMIIQAALQVVGSACAEIGRNEVCFGHSSIEATLQDGVDEPFDDSGDIIGLDSLVEIATYALDPVEGTWGISMLAVQADLPEEVEDNFTLVLIGDSNLRPDTSSRPEATDTFLLSSNNDPTCSQVPDGLLVRSPEGQRARITLNNVELVMSSSVFVAAQPNGDMLVQGIDGSIEVTASGQTETITAAMETAIPLDQNLLASGPPSPPVTLAPNEIFPFDFFAALFSDDSIGSQSLFSITDLPPPIYVTSAQPWTDTDIVVNEGQQVVVFAWGSMNTCFGFEEEFCYFNNPAGKSETSCTLAQCLVDGAPFGRLVMRIGNGSAMDIGVGGLFTVPSSGALSFGINDAGWDDNAGGYIVRVIPVP